MKKHIIIFVFTLGFFACDDILEIDNISKDIIMVLAPVEGVTIPSTTVSFSWEVLEEANEYRVQVAFPTFENAQQILVDSTVTTNNLSKTIENGNYQWRVKALNSEFETDYTTQSFSVEE